MGCRSSMVSAPTGAELTSGLRRSVICVCLLGAPRPSGRWRKSGCLCPTAGLQDSVAPEATRLVRPRALESRGPRSHYHQASVHAGGGLLMDSTIASLRRPVRDCIAAFDLAAMCRYRDGQLGVTRNPAGCGGRQGRAGYSGVPIGCRSPRKGGPFCMPIHTAWNSDPQRHQRKSLTRNLFRGKSGVTLGRKLDSTKTTNSETVPNTWTMNGEGSKFDADSQRVHPGVLSGRVRQG